MSCWLGRLEYLRHLLPYVKPVQGAGVLHSFMSAQHLQPSVGGLLLQRCMELLVVDGTETQLLGALWRHDGGESVRAMLKRSMEGLSLGKLTAFATRALDEGHFGELPVLADSLRRGKIFRNLFNEALQWLLETGCTLRTCGGWFGWKNTEGETWLSLLKSLFLACLPSVLSEGRVDHKAHCGVFAGSESQGSRGCSGAVCVRAAAGGRRDTGMHCIVSSTDFRA